MSYTRRAPAIRAAAKAGTTVSKSIAWTTAGRSRRIRKNTWAHHRGSSHASAGWPSGARRRKRWIRSPARCSSAGYASSRSQRIAWTSKLALDKVPASFAIRGSRPAGLFERTKTTRTAMSSQERVDLLRDLGACGPVSVGVRPIPFQAELLPDRGADPRRVDAGEDVRSDGEGLRPFRVLPQRDAGHAEETAFLLKAAGVSHHDRRVLLEHEHVEVAGWLDPSERRQRVRPLLESELTKPLRGARVDREDDGKAGLAGGGLEGVQGLRELFLRVHVLGSVKREDEVPARPQSEPRKDVRFLCRDREVLGQGIDHAVPDHVDARRDVLLSQVLLRRRRRREKQVRQLVRDDSVDLLGHLLVERPDAGFDVLERAVLLPGEEGPGDGRVRVAVDDDEVRPLRRVRDLPHRRRDLQVGRLLLQLELFVRLAELHVPEEDPVHHQVVMLTRMDEDVVVVQPVEGLHDRGHLDDFRTRPDDRDDAAHGRNARIIGSR